MSVGSKEARRILAYPKSVPACIPAATDETSAGRRRAVHRCSSPRAARKTTSFAPSKRAEEWSPHKHQPQPQLGPPRKKTQRSLSYWTEKGEIQGETETKAEQRSVGIQYRNGPRSLASKLWSTARLSSGKSSSYPARWSRTLSPRHWQLVVMMPTMHWQVRGGAHLLGIFAGWESLFQRYGFTNAICPS
jgi:hypothetical protein